jgi:hypothetical protein
VETVLARGRSSVRLPCPGFDNRDRDPNLSGTVLLNPVPPIRLSIIPFSSDDCFSAAASEVGSVVSGAASDVSSAASTVGTRIAGVADFVPNCFAWQSGCESILSHATGGRYCSRLFDEGCTQPIGEIRAQACFFYGCLAATYDGSSFHFHEALGLAVDLGITFSPSISACRPHDQAFGSFGPVGLSTSRSNPEGAWSRPSPSAGVSMKYGFGLVYWFN